MSKGFNNFLKRTGQTALVVGMVAGAGLTAHAAEKQAMTTANLNMRTGQSSNSAIVTTIPKGETVNVLEDKGSWWKVDYKGQQGYSAKRYLVVRNNKPIKEDVVVKADVLNVRSGPSTSFKRIGQVKNGQVLKATGKTDGWYEINFNGQVGYVSGDYVTVNGQSEGGGTTTPAKGEMKCTASSLRIRSGAGTNHKTIGYLNKGEVVSVLEKTSNGWFKIKTNDGKVGYCSGTYLESVNGGSGSGEESSQGFVKVTATKLNVRSGAGTGYRVVSQVSNGQALEKLAVASNGWVKVKLANGTVGWVSGEFVTATGNPNAGAEDVKPASGTVKVTATRLNVRSGAGTEHGVITQVSKDDVLTLVAKHSNGWVKVKLANGTEGWVSGKYVVNYEKPEEKPVKPSEVNSVPVVKIENSVIELTVGDKWSNDMVKFTATDKEDTEAKALTIKVEGNVDTSKAGDYQVKVSATDMQGATGSATAKVVVKEKETVPPTAINAVPVIDAKNVTINVGGNINGMFTANDKEDGDLTSKVKVEGTEAFKLVGEHKVQLTVEDSKGAKASKEIVVTVKAVEPTLTAENVTIKEGDKFDVAMAKAVAKDCEGKDISKDVKIVAGEVNTDKAGTYNVTLGVTDKWGLKATKEIKVVVEKSAEEVNNAPVITAKEDLVLTVGDKFENSMLNAKATDKEDGNVDVKIEGTVNTDKAGSYELTLVAKDSKGATTTKKVTVTVKEKAVTPDEAPVLTVGQKEVKITEGGKVSVADFKATANDKEDGDLTKDIKLLGSYDVNKPGTYELELRVMDSKGNITKEAVKLVVNPKMAVINAAPTIDVKDVYTMSPGDKFDVEMIGATAHDKEDGDLTSKINLTHNVKDEIGTYKATLTVTDSQGAKTSKEITVKVIKRNEAPVIHVNDTYELTVGDKFDYSMLNATATDDYDGNLTDKIQYSGNVDTSKAGTYKVSVFVADSSDMMGQKWVTVTVKDKVIPNTDPTITADNITIDQDSKFDFSMLNSKATDKEDGDLTSKIEYKGIVNTAVPKTYTVTCSVEDSKGRPASVVVTVTVREVANEKPVLNVPQERFELTQGDAWSNDRIGATATDKEDGKLDVKYEGNVDTNKPGEYTITVSATDSKGQTTSAKVVVVVKEKEVPNEAPVVTADDITVNQGDKFDYSMLNAKATDKEDGSAKITYDGAVNTAKPGKYTVVVTATDSKGATASIEVVVTVKEAVAESYNPNSSEFKSAVTSQMVSLVNQHRASNGVPALNNVGRLNSSANGWSKYMADNGFFDHVAPNGATANSVFPQYAPISGENIVLIQFKVTGDMGQDAQNLANQLFGMWKNSSGHNANMLDDLFAEFGFGMHAVQVSEGSPNWSIYATQHFSGDISGAEAPKDEVKKEEAPKTEEAPKEEAPVVTPEAKPEVKPEETVKPSEPQAKPEVEAPVAPTPEPEKTPEQPKEEASAKPEATMSGAEMTDGANAEMN
ncbi:hypothetical protein UT300012_24370 [Paraclostridium bifermentans]